VSALAPTLQSFFTAYLIGQRGASEHTIRAYRDTMRLLLAYARERTGIEPADLDIGDLDAELISSFLTMLEHDRGNSDEVGERRATDMPPSDRLSAGHHRRVSSRPLPHRACGSPAHGVPPDSR
jgi:integrase/recombinase XerD